MKQVSFIDVCRRSGSVLLGSFILLAFSAGAFGQPKLFDAASRIFETGRFSEGANPIAIAVGDIDGDGDRDVVTALSLADPGFGVMRNNGDKTYTRTAFHALGTGNNRPKDIKLLDFDSDGDLDILVTVSNFSTGNLYVWRNAGKGTFAPASTFPTGGIAGQIAIADLNGDGFADVAIANESSTNNFSRLLHNGQTGPAAGYTAAVTATVGSGWAWKIRAADFNRDGLVDLAIGILDIYILFNTGNNTFAAPVVYNPAPAAQRRGYSIGIGDVDNDGDIDLIGEGVIEPPNSGASFAAFTILRNNGSGVFGTPEMHQHQDMFTGVNNIKTADLNGDGFLDIMACNPSGRTPEGWNLMLSNGTGGYHSTKLFPAGQWTYSIEPTDVDNDGDLDMLTASRDSNALTFFENLGNGTFRTLPHYEIATFNDATVSADIDNDGDIDVVTNNETDVSSNQGYVAVQKNNGNGTFAVPVFYNQPRDYFDMKLRDLNGDGFVDIVFGPDSDAPAYHLGFAINRGDGSFFPTVILLMGSCGEGTIDAFDLDNDGDRDIVFTEEQACGGGAARRIFIYRNDGNQTFVNVRQIPFFGGPQDLAGADLDADGRIDIVTIHSNGMAFLKNLGNFTFAEPVISPGPAGLNLYLFELADLNRDGKLDVGTIVNQDYFYARVGTMMGNGDGTFGPVSMRTGATTAESLRSAADIDIADVNGDLYPDLNVTNYASNDLSVFLTNADGTIQPQQRYGLGNTPHYSTAADFNGDGKVDFAGVVRTNFIYRDYLVILKNIAPSVRKAAFDFDGDGKSDASVFRPSDGIWYLQQSTAGFTAKRWGISSDRIVPGDYDGDGKADVAVFRRNENSTWYILNSSNNTFRAVTWGASNIEQPLLFDTPVPADYDGDGKTDIAIWRLTDNISEPARYLISQSSTGQARIQQWGSSGDVPVQNDFDGDQKTDLAIYRSGQWHVLQSSQGYAVAQFGIASDKPAAADYDGDGKADHAVYRDGVWHILGSTRGYFVEQFGIASDIPVPADYDGDGKTDVAVYRDGVWYLLRSTQGFTAFNFGVATDKPVPAAFLP